MHRPASMSNNTFNVLKLSIGVYTSLFPKFTAGLNAYILVHPVHLYPTIDNEISP